MSEVFSKISLVIAIMGFKRKRKDSNKSGKNKLFVDLCQDLDEKPSRKGKGRLAHGSLKFPVARGD